nr:uncharacterized protein LOC113402084 [Vanessa tameamea]
MNKFGCCTSTKADQASILNCKLCQISFHYRCIFPQKENKKLSSDLKSSWICPDCSQKCRVPNHRNKDNTPVRGNALDVSDSKEDSADDNITLRVRPNQDQIGQSLSRDIQNIIKSEFSAMKLDLSSISNEITSLRQEIQDIKIAMGFINDEHNKINDKIFQMETKFKAFDALVTSVEHLKSVSEKIEMDINTKDQWARRSNIEICGIPEKKGENLLRLTEEIAVKAGFDLKPSDIDFVTRVASNSQVNKPKPIVIRLQARYRKDDFLACLKKLKLMCSDLGFAKNDSRIYFNDHLTKFNKMLLQRAKTLSKEQKYKYVWVKNCSIMVRKGDTSPVIHIANVNDLKKIK